MRIFRMLFDLINSTSEIIEEYQTSLQIKNQEFDIQNTLAQLKNVNFELEQLIDGYKLRNELFPDQDDLFKEKLYTIYKDIQEVKNKFIIDKKFKQATEIQQISTSINDHKRMIERFWFLYVQNHIHPLQELATIAETLPQMKDQISRVNEILNKLESYKQRTPNLKVFDDFKKYSTQLSDLLEDIKGLDEDKVIFLKKILKKTASVSDLTPEILEWCKSTNISISLVVRFKDSD